LPAPPSFLPILPFSIPLPSPHDPLARTLHPQDLPCSSPVGLASPALSPPAVRPPASSKPKLITGP
jgi:hypothetical protein